MQGTAGGHADGDSKMGSMRAAVQPGWLLGCLHLQLKSYRDRRQVLRNLEPDLPVGCMPIAFLQGTSLSVLTMTQR